MKVLNLRCTNGHGFEGWFASDDDYMAQNGAGQIECPLCADKVIMRVPSAPRLNLGIPDEPGASVPMVKPPPPDLQTMWLKAVHHVLANTEDVGPAFAEEARRIHYGEAEQRGIRGQATEDQRAALADEGIEAMPLPMPAAIKGSAH